MYLLHPGHIAFMIDPRKSLHLGFFKCKKLDNLHAAKTLLHECVHLCHLFPKLPECLSCQTTEEESKPKDKGKNDEADQRQSPVEGHENGQNPNEDEDIF